jgi:8-amino-7-oxononanoate synthase
VPILIGDSRATLDASRALEKEGFLIVAIRPPTVPPGTARLRIAFTALHPEAEIVRLAETIRVKILPALAAA